MMEARRDGKLIRNIASLCSMFLGVAISLIETAAQSDHPGIAERQILLRPRLLDRAKPDHDIAILLRNGMDRAAMPRPPQPPLEPRPTRGLARTHVKRSNTVSIVWRRHDDDSIDASLAPTGNIESYNVRKNELDLAFDGSD